MQRDGVSQYLLVASSAQDDPGIRSELSANAWSRCFVMALALFTVSADERVGQDIERTAEHAIPQLLMLSL